MIYWMEFLFLFIKLRRTISHRDGYRNYLSIHLSTYSRNICGAYAMCPCLGALGKRVGRLRAQALG